MKKIVAPPKWVPKFEDVTFYGPFGVKYKPNPPDYFATEATANEVELRLKNILPADQWPLRTVKKPYPGNGGPYYSIPPDYWVVEFGGWEIPAGVLAAYYVRNPEDEFPGVADALVKRLVETGFAEAALEARAA